jgi:pimeloyl-ACP methyl ester carboxylesterase
LKIQLWAKKLEAVLLALCGEFCCAPAQTQSAAGVKTIIRVHGAWADGSSWSKFIPLLEAKGLHVVAVQIPLTSFADDVSATQRAIALEDEPVLLVGHSYAGAVITEAGNDPKAAYRLRAASRQEWFPQADSQGDC